MPPAGALPAGVWHPSPQVLAWACFAGACVAAAIAHRHAYRRAAAPLERSKDGPSLAQPATQRVCLG